MSSNEPVKPYLSSSQEFIHLLTLHEKHTGLPPKIEIASEAWQAKVFYLPKKGEVLAEWVIGTVLAASSSSSMSPLFDQRYWTLLLSILTSQPHTTKSWLAPLIHRLPPLTKVFIAFLTHLPASYKPSLASCNPNSNDNEVPTELLEVFTKAMSLLFPHASRRMSLDALAEILCAVFRFQSARTQDLRRMVVQRELEERQVDQMRGLFLMILQEYKRAFGVASVGMKKKVYNNFLQSYLGHWMRAVVGNAHGLIENKSTQEKDKDVGSLESSVLSVGIQTLLCVDVLRFTECHLPNGGQAQSEAHDSTSKLVHLVGRLGESLKRGEEDCDLVREAEDELDVDADMRSVTLEFLPVFYASYVRALYRHRGQLFSVGGSATTRDGFRKAACAFLGLVLGLVDAVERGVKEEAALRLIVWRTRVGLLTVLWSEGGYVPLGTSTGGERSEGENKEAKGPQEMLSKIVSRVVGVLDQPSASLKPLAIQSLSAIIRTDYDIVRPFVPPILARVLVLPLDDPVRPGMQEGERGAYVEFLDLLLEYHVKTRTLDELVGVMLTTGVWEGSLSSSLRGAEGRGGVVAEDDPFLERLGKAIRTFGTVGQCVGLLGGVVAFVERGLGVLEGVERKGKEDVDMDVDMEESVGLRLELGARIVCVVLACLNFEMVSSAPSEGLEQLRGVKGRVGRVVGRLVGRLRLDSGRMERERELEHGLCVLLRVKYVLDRDVFAGGLGFGVGSVLDESGGVLEGLVRLVERGEPLLPELVFELVRTMFLQISTRRRELGSSSTSASVLSEKGHEGGKRKGKGKKDLPLNTENERFFDSLLAFVERYYPRVKSGTTAWSGKDYDLKTRGREGKTKCALAIVWMVVERWLSEVYLLATPRQIRRFLDVVFGVGLVDLVQEEKATMEKGSVSPQGILLNMLHAAWFWEFGRIRKELVELLKERTLPLSPNRLESDRDMGPVRERISTFRVLLYFPLEYFSFQVLCGFVRCAVEVDGFLARMWRARERNKEGDGGGEMIKGLVVLRVFVRRVCVFVGGGGVLDFRGKSEAELLLRMLEEPNVVDCDVNVDESVKAAYLSASLDLAEVWLMKLFKSSKKSNDPEAVLRVLKYFNLDSICGSGRDHKRTLTCECFILMVELLDREVGVGVPNAAVNTVHEDVLVALRVLRGELVEGLYVRIVREVSKEGMENDAKVMEYVGLVRVWDSLICLGRSVGGLGLDDDPQQVPSRFIAGKLVSVLIPHVQLRDALNGDLAELCIGVFAVMLGEVECRVPSRSGDGQEYLELVLAVYVSLANKVSVSGIKEMDVRFGRTAKRLAVSDFEYLLSFIAESLSDVDSGETVLLESRFTQLVHVGSLLIRDHPSHSFVCLQKFMARCLGLFNDNPIYVEGEPRLEVLEMVGQYCSDQQAALRAQDSSLIWLLISKSLAPSQVHDVDTRTEMFHKIVSILMCLIRLRRDLVVLGLPHLGLILRRMVQALRGCRPNLGAKQTAIVMNTQPQWISHARSLGGDEAKALSRLLESLTVKTTVRLYFNADASNATKAESLAKPFSKHAAYVLKAYVEAMNDPLCVVSLEVRKELREGLFALCGMMGVHSRDALMAGGGLDAGAKAVLKSVWKEWEGVRYVGKG